MSLNEIAVQLLADLNAYPEKVLRDLTAAAAGFSSWKDMNRACKVASPLTISNIPNKYRVIYSPREGNVQVEFYGVYDAASDTDGVARFIITSDNSVQI